jgi:CO/xanthine dehydrogenase FAD-binding subunit
MPFLKNNILYRDHTSESCAALTDTDAVVLAESDSQRNERQFQNESAEKRVTEEPNSSFMKADFLYVL